MFIEFRNLSEDESKPKARQRILDVIREAKCPVHSIWLFRRGWRCHYDDETIRDALNSERHNRSIGWTIVGIFLSIVIIILAVVFKFIM